MLVATSASPDPHDRPDPMTPRQRRHIHRMLNGHPTLYQKLRGDPRSHMMVAALMNHYRAELLFMLREMLEASLKANPPRQLTDTPTDLVESETADPCVDNHISTLYVAGVGSPYSAEKPP